ncbi:hypothetical protein MRB53_042240 [Persea americana]|nr:hypothetical protein MRB53_042240 [Persea americana]
MTDNADAGPPVMGDEVKVEIQEEARVEAGSPRNLDEEGPEDEAHEQENEPKIAAKKDTTLREFLSKMDDYAPIIPDAVTNYYLTLAGLPPPPQTSQHLARLLALATQKFIADIAADAYQHARIRTSHTTSNTASAMLGAPGIPGQGLGLSAAQGVGGKDGNEKAGKGGAALGMQRAGFGGGGQSGGQGKTVLTMEDLGMAVGEYGINVRRGEFYR